jgi:hypothetical protein
MAASQEAMTRGPGNGPLVGAVFVLGLTLAMTTLRRSRRHPRQPAREHHPKWVAYLRDHLAGADTAIQVVAQLKDTHRDACEGTLFASLHAGFSFSACRLGPATPLHRLGSHESSPPAHGGMQCRC